MSSEDSALAEGVNRLRRVGLRRVGLWVAPFGVLFVLWFWLVFSSGGFLPRQWLLPSVFLGFLGLTLSLLIAYPRRPRQLTLVLLALFVLFGGWTALSGFWAASRSLAWMESGRTFTYVMVFALAAVYLTDAATRRAFRYLMIGAGLLLLLACISRLWSTQDLGPLFFGNRFSYPVTYPNTAAALFLIGFWPLVWLAASPEERAPVRWVALGVATGLLGLAFMTQSRGAIWSLAISAVVMFVISPARLRTLLYLLVTGSLMVYEFPNLNHYWRAGVEGASGALGARTLLVASITAGFVGMILALLERWVNVSRKMKAIFGSVLFAGLVAAIIYASVVVTADVGGPFKWLGSTWKQFAAQTTSSTTGIAGTTGPSSTSQPGSRFVVVDSNGRVNIWRVAWKEFKTEPIKGVGAGNFVFQYDRLRSSELSKPAHPHSLFLQVLAETGIVGGVLFVGGLFLALFALLWPRCTAGWRRARGSWLLPAKPVNDRLCNPRWGADPRAYGWEMALLAALVYWLVHGSVEWLWQMIGVSLPAFLILAAAVAQMDARAQVMWPRLSRMSVASRFDPAVPSGTPRAESPGEPTERRTHVRRQRRDSLSLVQPPGLLSHLFRLTLVVLSLLVLVVAGLPYLALRYESSAIALARTDGYRAIQRADSAHWLQLTDPSPYLTQASIYEGAAVKALHSEASDGSGAVLDNLALAIGACDKAINVEPADWSLWYRAGVSVINFLMAGECAAGHVPDLDVPSLIPDVPGLTDMSLLSARPNPLSEVGQSAGSLAQDETSRATAERYRSMSQQELRELALTYLAGAKERNPLASQTGEAVLVAKQLVVP